MKLVWTVVSVVFQFGMAYILTMGAIFAGCAMPQSSYRLRKQDNMIISSSFYLLPASCITVLILIIHYHRSAGPALSYLWNLLPFLLVLLYLFYARTFVPKQETMPYSQWLEEHCDRDREFSPSNTGSFDSFQLELAADKGVSGQLILNGRELGEFQAGESLVITEEGRDLFCSGRNRLFLLIERIGTDEGSPAPALSMVLYGIKKSAAPDRRIMVLDYRWDTGELEQNSQTIGCRFELEKSE